MADGHTGITRRQALAAGAALATATAVPVAAPAETTARPPQCSKAREAPVDFACYRCGGRNVTRDAWADWDIEAQEWVLCAVYDHAYCHDCDDDIRLDIVGPA